MSEHTKQHIPLEGQPNFRDLGGYKTADGRTVKSGLIYRSGELSSLTDEDIIRLQELGIKNVIDFRSEAEVAWRGEDRLPALGVPAEAAKEDYLKSNEYRSNENEEQLR